MGARIGVDGGLLNGVGAVSSSKLATGVYTILFERNVRNCIYAASSSNYHGYAMTVQEWDLATNGVYVATTSPAGSLADASFYVTVLCGR
jgi:hypothetical protein